METRFYFFGKRPESPVAVRIFAKTFMYYLAISIGLTIFQLAMEYVNAEERLQNSLIGINETFNSLLVDALWKYDFERIQNHLRSIANNVDVSQVVLQDEESGRRLFFGRKKGPPELNGSKFTVFPLNHESGGKLGELILFYNERLIFEKILDSLYLIVGNAFLKTLALWLIFYWISSRMITRPIKKIRSNLKETLTDEDVQKTETGKIKMDFEKMRREITLVTDKLKKERERASTASERVQNLALEAVRFGMGENGKSGETDVTKSENVTIGKETFPVESIAWITIKEHYLSVRKQGSEGWEEFDSFGNLKSIEDECKSLFRANRATLVNPQRISGSFEEKGRVYLILEDGLGSKFPISKNKESEVGIIMRILGKATR